MKSKKIIIIGGGGHAKVLIEAILSSKNYEIEGILDGQLTVGESVLGFPVLGGDKFLDKSDDIKKSFLLAIGIGSTKASDKRKVIYEKLKKSGFRFPAIIHNRGYVSKNAKLHDGVQVMANAVIDADAQIQENTIINISAIVEHDCKIASHSHISLNAVLGGNVIVGECSHIGMGARVLQGIKIGNYVTVGAGAVVTKDVEDRKLVLGMPAKEGSMHEANE